MKRILLALALIPVVSFAQVSSSDLVGLGMPGELAQKVIEASGVNAVSTCTGTLTATGATPVVTATTCAKTASRIFLSRTSAETGAVNVWVSAISNGVSFSVTGEAADTGTYNWLIVNPVTP